MTKLEKLNKKFNKARLSYLAAMDDVVEEVSIVSGIEDISGDDFADDGLGIALGDSDVHASIRELIECLNKNGTITKGDLQNAFF